MMDGMMNGMNWGIGVVGLLILIGLILGIAALISISFRRNDAQERAQRY